MKKGTPSEITVKRISTSPYFSLEFAQLEKKTIEDRSKVSVLPQNDARPSDIIITNTHTDVSALNEEVLKKCRLMIHPNSGYDNFPPDFVAQADFPIIIGNPIRAQAVTNYILSALMNHFSPVRSEQRWSETRKWPRRLLCECSVLIIGQGHIGGLLKDSLLPLARTIQVYDPFKNLTELNPLGVDIVILACSLNKENVHFIDRDFLLKLSPDFLLINAARGPLVKTADLLEVLSKQAGAAAVLDVFEKEPADFSSFLALKNLIVTSHIAGVYQKIDQVCVDFEAQVICDWLQSSEEHFRTHYKTMILQNRLIKEGFLI